MPQQQTATAPGRARFYQQFKKQSDSPSLAAPTTSPIVTVSDFSFSSRPGSFSSARSETIDASTARPQTQLHPQSPSSTGGLHIRNLNLPAVTAAKARSEPSHPRPPLSLILSSDASTLTSARSDSSSAPSNPHSRASSYSGSRIPYRQRQTVEPLVKRSSTPFVRPAQSTVPESVSYPTSRSRSSSFTSNHSHVPGYTAFEIPPPLPPRPSRAPDADSLRLRKSEPQLIDSQPDPLRSHPPSPLSNHGGSQRQYRSMSASHPSNIAPAQQARPPYRNSEPCPTKEREPDTAAPKAPPKVPPKIPLESSGEICQEEPPQRQNRNGSYSFASETAVTAVHHRPVYRNAASDPLLTRTPTYETILSPSSAHCRSSSASASASCSRTESVQDTLAASQSPLRTTNEAPEPGRRRSSPLSKVSTPPVTPPPETSFTPGLMPVTTAIIAQNNSQSFPTNATADPQVSKPLPSPPVQGSSATDLALSNREHAKQSRLSLNSLRSLSLLPRSSKVNLQSQSHAQPQPQSPLYQARFTSHSRSTTSTSTTPQNDFANQSQSQMPVSASASTLTATPNTTPISISSSKQPPSSKSPPSSAYTNPSTPLLTLTTHVETQLSLTTHLFNIYSHRLTPTESQWVSSTIADTSRAVQSIKVLTESLRVEEQTNNGKVGLGSRMMWKVRDARKAKEKREDLTLCHSSLLSVLGRLQSVQRAEEGMATGTGSETVQGDCQSQGQSTAQDGTPSEPSNPVSVEVETVHAHQHQPPAPTFPPPPPPPSSLCHSRPPAPSRPPPPPPPPRRRQEKPTPGVSLQDHEKESAPAPTPSTPSALSPSSTSAHKPPSPPWDLTMQKQVPGMELVVDAGVTDAQLVNSSTVQFALCDPESLNLGVSVGVNDMTDSGSASSLGLNSVSEQGKLDEELLEMLAWRWGKGRAKSTATQ
ncbi:uncharacterized protein BDV17DRAFT_256748 [Aspergillus undulatus]|uniref:uncharacterized protein n=1 Tax=Aspergillus undulatus TaxID=1810928 RepID=UPI003CCE4270